MPPRPTQYRDPRADGDQLVSLHEPDARVRHVPETVIQDAWRTRRFDASELATTTGEPVTVLHPGFLNADAGPDFTSARLRIGAVEWGGDVEVHRTSGEWIEHRHDADPRYDRVVLHVTLIADRHTGKLRRADGTVIPEVVLYPLLQDSLRSLLVRFYTRPAPAFYCADSWAHVPGGVKRAWVRTLGYERLAARKRALADAFLTAPDLDALLYERIMRALGYAKNADPMEALARRVPLRRLAALPDRRDAEALLFGAAGLLPSPRDLLGADRASIEYVTDLRARLDRVPAIDPVPPLQPTVWSRARLRAASLPTRRIAQAAALFGPGGTLRDEPLARLNAAALGPKPLPALRHLLTDARPSTFWQTHFDFGRDTKPGTARIGRGHADRVLVNAVLPTLLVAADQHDDPALRDAAFGLYETLPAGSDRVTRMFEQRGTVPASALESQGLHQLYRTRCTVGHCLSCRVGRHVLKGEGEGR